MYEEFFNYIATRIISYFEQECDNLHDGDRFCFKLDNGELVEQVNAALYDIPLLLILHLPVLTRIIELI